MFFRAWLDHAAIRSSPPGPLQTHHDVSSFYVHNTAHSIDIALRRRTSYPATFCKQIGSTSYQLGYGQSNADGNAEFLNIVVARDGQLRISRDVRATLPLFYGSVAGKFVISNSYDEVTAALPRLTLNPDSLEEILAPHVNYRPTLWQEIRVLDEREILSVDREGMVTVQYPSSRTWNISSDIPSSDPAHFVSQLENLLCQTLSTYASRSNIGFELSGGLDSSLLPLYLSRYDKNQPWSSITILVPGASEVTQRAKIAAIQQYAPYGHLRTLKLKTHHYPLANILGAPQAQLFYPQRDIYLELFDSMAETFKALNVDTVFTGLGGDEVFEHIVNSNEQLGTGQENIATRTGALPSYCTNDFRHYIQMTTPKKQCRPIPILSTSVAGPCLANNSYIERDIWPVALFKDHTFYTYCQGLPWTLKKNRQLLRAYYHASKFPDVIYDQTYPNEHFKDFFDDAFLSKFYTPFVEYFAQNSITAALGYIDNRNLLHTYQNMTSSPMTAKENDIFALFPWLCAEINLHTAHRTHKWTP
ncbi:MAG TPA: asparagine synthase-related protein [Nevskiaceae bacterium]|nr:asparagine synthase-related protein [Nevskiaceae bacterium]